MKVHNLAGILLATASLFVGAVSNVAAAESEYSFNVRNNAKVKITKLLVSEDKQDWGYFDIGQGIAPGSDTKLVWDSSTNNKVAISMLKRLMPTALHPRRLNLIFAKPNFDLEF